MPRHDLICSKCETVQNDVIIKVEQLVKGKVKGIKCDACGGRTFTVYWGNGIAPSVSVQSNDPEAVFDRCKTIGEYWDRRGFSPGSEANKKANQQRLARMRKKKK